MNPVSSTGNVLIARPGTIPFISGESIKLILAVVVFAGATAAQVKPLPPAPLPVDPTPLRELLTDQERAQIARAHDGKELLEVLLRISDTHLTAAASATEAGDTNTAERELDIYNKAITAASETAFDREKGKEKRKLGKIIEQKLYSQIKVIESIQRRFPAELVAYADAALKHAKELHDHSLNETLASGMVIDEKPQRKKQAPPPGPPAPEKPKQRLLDARWVRDLRPANHAQMPGDYMTEGEDNKVREAQEIDQRTKVFIKIADRRLEAITHGAAPAEDDSKDKKGKKKKKKDDDDKGWGPVPNVSKAELLNHYTKAISELEDKLDDANERNPKSGALRSALVTLRDGTERQLSVLHSLESQMQTDDEKRSLRDAIAKAEEAHKGAVEGLKRF